MYNFNTVLYQFLEAGILDITFMGRDQELKELAFSLYPLSLFLYSPFKGYHRGLKFLCRDFDINPGVYDSIGGIKTFFKELVLPIKSGMK